MDLMLRPVGGEYFGGDLVVADGDLALDKGLNTAVLISLFTDRRAEEGDDLPDPQGDRRGWWGDGLNGGHDLIGSRLWLLTRRKVTPETRRLYEEYTREALAWLVDDGVAASLDVSAAWVAADRLEVSVAITRPDGRRHKYAYAWDAQALAMEVIASAL